MKKQNDNNSIKTGYYKMARRYEFYFRVAKQYFTHSLHSFVKYCFWPEKVKFISTSRHVMFFLLYRQKGIDKINYKFQREITEITSSINSRVRLWKKKTIRVPGVVFMNFASGIFSGRTLVSI